MALEFREVSAGVLTGFTADAPSGCIIGVIGGKNSGVSDLMKLAGGTVEPTSGELRAPANRRLLSAGETLNLAPADVIALDQALATQDAVVRGRTIPALERLRRSGSTVFVASHEERLLETLCDEVWWIEAGELAAKGDPKETLARYRRFVAQQLREWGEKVPPRLSPSSRGGEGQTEVISVEALGANGAPTLVWKSGEYVKIRATVLFHQAVATPVIGMLLRTQIGFEVYGTDNRQERVEISARQPGSTIQVEFQFLCDLCPQTYTVTIYSEDATGAVHDWTEDAITIAVIDERSTVGVANLRAKVTVAEAAAD